MPGDGTELDCREYIGLGTHRAVPTSRFTHTCRTPGTYILVATCGLMKRRSAVGSAHAASVHSPKRSRTRKRSARACALSDDEDHAAASSSPAVPSSDAMQSAVETIRSKLDSVLRECAPGAKTDVGPAPSVSLCDRLQGSCLGWVPGDDVGMVNEPRSTEEMFVSSHLLHPHLCRDILQGFLQRDGLVPDAVQCDERLMHMISHIVREHGVIIIKSPSVQQMHVVEVLDVSFSRPEGKQSRNYVCPITATEAMLTRNSYQITVLLNMRHSVYVPEEGNRVEGLQSTRTGGAKTSQTVCTSMPSMDNPDEDVLKPVDDPRLSVTLWSSSATAGKLLYEPEPGYKLLSVKLLTNHVLTTLTAAVGGVWCHLSDGPTRSMDDLFDLGVKRIVKGQCKVLLQQEQPAFNFITVHRGMTGKATWVASLRARPQSKMRSTSTTYVFVRCGDKGASSEVQLWCTLPYVKMDIPPLAIFRILGVSNSRVAARMIASGGICDGESELPDEGLLGSSRRKGMESWIRWALVSKKSKDAAPDLDECSLEDIMIWIARTGTSNKTPAECTRHLKHLIANEFMPCMGLSSEPAVLHRKARVFAMMVFKAVSVARGEVVPDNRDHCGNKQVDGAADLLAQLIRQQHRNVVRSFAAHARAQVDASAQLDVARSFTGRRIGDHEAYSLSTGNWGLQKGGSTQKGAAQHQTRQGFPCTVSQLRRVSMQVDRKGKHAMPRQVSITSWGYICPVESPEGHACGLVKALALLARICPSRPFGTLWVAILRCLKEMLVVLGSEPRGFSPPQTSAAMWVNGIFVGTVLDVHRARRMLVEERRRHALPHDAEIFVLNDEELHVSAEAGGLRRPLIILEPTLRELDESGGSLDPDQARRFAAQRLSVIRDVMWRNRHKPLPEVISMLLYEGCVEYVGPRESDNCIIKLWAARDDEEWQEEDELLEQWGSDDEDDVDEGEEAGQWAVRRSELLGKQGPQCLGLDVPACLDPVTAPRPSPDAGADETEPVEVLPCRAVDRSGKSIEPNACAIVKRYRHDAKTRALESIAGGRSPDLWAVVERRAASDMVYDLLAAIATRTDESIVATPGLLIPDALRPARARDHAHWNALRSHVSQTGDASLYCGGEAKDDPSASKRGKSRAPSAAARAAPKGKLKRHQPDSNGDPGRSASSAQSRHASATDEEKRRARRYYAKVERAKRRGMLHVLETELKARQLYSRGVPEDDIMRFFLSRNRARANRERAQARRRPRLSRWQAAPYTHAEIHPTAVYGFTTSLLVLFSHNQAPRNTYSDAMIKAAQGVIRDKNFTRGSTSMWYPQRAVVASHASRVFCMDRHASGSNPMVVVLSDMGDNQEDSKTVSQNFVDSGGLRTAIHRAYVEEAREGFSADSQRFKLPGKDCLGVRAASYDHIDKDTAAVMPGQVIRGGDALICKVMLVADMEPAGGGGGAHHGNCTGPSDVRQDSNAASFAGGPCSAADGRGVAPAPVDAEDTHGGGDIAADGCRDLVAQQFGIMQNAGASGKVMRERDQTVIARSTEGASIVEAVMRTSGRDGKQYTVVSTREMRIPQRGDKTTNRHGQKGVMSVVVCPDDLPYTVDGVTPDIALNPHAIPSRMTCGMFFEMVAAKAGVMEGVIVDGTVHDTPVTSERVLRVLAANGFEHGGEQVLYSGRTGEPLKGYVAIGPSHEHRLRQMVKDKIATRETGPVTPLCGQPVEGRSRYGGLRVGEMERDCLIAHGASAVILDRMMEQSDDSIGAVCKKCGLLAIANRARMPHASVETSGPWCLNCETGEHVRTVRFPKAWKVLMQEMMSMNVRPSLVLEDDNTIDYGSSASVGLRISAEAQVRVPLLRKSTGGNGTVAQYEPSLVKEDYEAAGRIDELDDDS